MSQSLDSSLDVDSTGSADSGGAIGSTGSSVSLGSCTGDGSTGSAESAAVGVEDDGAGETDGFILRINNTESIDPAAAINEKISAARGEVGETSMVSGFALAVCICKAAKH